MKKYFAECLGTMVLTLLGCGAAVFLGCGTPAGVVGTAFAFGLAVVAMACTIGDVSGCHINPAITLGAVLSGRINWKDAAGYWVSQFLGGILGAALLLWICSLSNFQMGGANVAGGVTREGAWLVEIAATFIFVLTALGATDEKKGSGKFAGLAIGLTLALIHIVCINLTGTSVNPARSLGPAIFVGGEALRQVYIFILAPLIGGALAAGAWKYFSCESRKAK